MSGVMHDPGLFGKLTPITRIEADVYRSRRFQRACTETANSTDGPIEPGRVLNPGWLRLVRIKRTRCAKLDRGFLIRSQTNGMRVKWRDPWAGTEAPGRQCRYLKAADPLFAYMDDFSDKGSRFQHFVIRQRKKRAAKMRRAIRLSLQKGGGRCAVNSQLCYSCRVQWEFRNTLYYLQLV